MKIRLRILCAFNNTYAISTNGYCENCEHDLSFFFYARKVRVGLQGQKLKSVKITHYPRQSLTMNQELNKGATIYYVRYRLENLFIFSSLFRN